MANQDKAGMSMTGETDTVIGEGMRLDGSIEFAGHLLIRGTISGQVVCPAGAAGKVVVDPSGCITGRVSAPHIVLTGRVEGPINASQLLEVQTTGRCDGDILYQRLDVHPGGIINGSLAPSSSSAPSAAEPPAHGQTISDSAAPESAAPAIASTNAPFEPVINHRLPLPNNAPTRKAGAPGRRIVFWTLAAGTLAFCLMVLYGRHQAAPIETPAVPAPPPEMPVVVLPSANPAPTQIAPPVASLPAQNPPAPLPPAASAMPATPVAPLAPAAGAPAVSATSSDEHPEPDIRKALAIPGVNPAKSASVLYLVVKEPAVFYKKRRDDPTAGTRIEVPQARTLSVPVSRNDMFRVARGSAIDIFYQGRKVGQSSILSGRWMSFTPVTAEE